MSETVPPEAPVATDNYGAVKDIEKQQQDENEVQKSEPNTSAASKSSSLLKWILGLVLLVGIICAIAIPLSLRNNDNATSTENAQQQEGNEQKPGTVVNNTTSDTIKTNGTRYFNTAAGPFNASIQLLSSDITDGYKDDSDLEESLNNAANFFLGITYTQNLNIGQISNSDYGDGVTLGAPEGGTGNEQPAMADVTDSVNKDTSSTTSKVTGSDYGTNNQENGVEEGDVIVSDGQYVYAAYGKYLVIWSTSTGTIVKTIEMPAANVTGQTAGTSGDTTLSSQKIASDMMYYPAEPSIVSLLLHDGRLLVTVTGYGPTYWYSGNGPQKVLGDYMATQLRLYDVATLVSSSSSTADAGLIGFKRLNGSYSSIRAVNGVAHLVATSYVNTYEYLAAPLSRYNFDNVTDAQYEQRVAQIAPELSLNFTFELMRELRAGGSTPKLTRINLWDDTFSDTGIEQQAYSAGLLNTLVLIHSIDLTASPTDGKLTVASSGSFVPGWAQVYGSDSRLVLAATVWQYDDVKQISKESTALLAYEMSGTSTIANSIGRVSGSILNPYSIDVVGDYLRIAVTIRNDTVIVLRDVAVDDTVSATQNNTSSSSPSVGGTDNTTDIIIDDPGFTWTPPDTENYIIVLSLPGANGENPGQMVEQGRVQLGKPKESFTSIRFFDNIAYAVTFEQTDPFYVVDLSTPTQPTILAALEISGFSSYLHPLDTTNTHLLAIGQDADSEGNIIGLMLTVFDVTVPSSPKNISKYNIQVDPNISSYSDSLWDYKAARYYDGYLFLPVDLANYNNYTSAFYGTMVFKIDKDTYAITEDNQCRVSNKPYDYYATPYETIAVDTLPNDNSTASITPNVTTVPCNYTGGWLPSRSMVFNGDLLTTRTNEVILTDLSTCGRLWNFTIDIPNPDGCQVYNNYYAS